MACPMSGWDTYEQDERNERERYQRMEEEAELRYHAEMQLEHDLYQAARFLLAHETLPQAMVRLGNLAMQIDYGEKEEEAR